MAKRFSIHDWQAKQIQLNLAEQDTYQKRQDAYQKRQDALTPGKNAEDFYGNMDARLAKTLGMSDDEFKDQVASRDIGDGGSSFPETDNVSPFAAKARDYIETFRKEYRDMSDDGIDEFSVEIINHLLDNTAAQAAAKIYFGKKGL
tara:strand:+ start:79 stop:516 length:438 start_codon:yes stop_codon:yes gene_type:complete